MTEVSHKTRISGETASMLVAASGWVRGEWGVTLMGVEFLWGKMKTFNTGSRIVTQL